MRSKRRLQSCRREWKACFRDSPEQGTCRSQRIQFRSLEPKPAPPRPPEEWVPLESRCRAWILRSFVQLELLGYPRRSFSA